MSALLGTTEAQLSYVSFGSRVDGAMARAFFTLLQHWSGAVTCPAC
jgi:hypothetical protein